MLLLIFFDTCVYDVISSVDHDGRQRISFSLHTNVTDQCLASVQVKFWQETNLGRLILSTDTDGKLAIRLETTASDPPVLVGFTGFPVSDNRYHRINLSHQRGRFKLKVDDSVTSNLKPDLKSFSQMTFLQKPLEFCGEFLSTSS